MKIHQLIAVTLLATVASRTPAAENSRPPNILFIYTDDQRYDAIGVIQSEQGERGRFPWLKTPNMDRLAKSGLRFKNSFVVNAVCSPSRATFLTGIYSHRNGVMDNFTPLPERATTLGTRMQKAGYATGYFGKWHMGKQETRPGFDTWASQIGHGWYNDCDLNIDGKMAKTKGWIDGVVTGYAIHFIQEQKSAGKPFFAVLGLKAPHGPGDKRADGRDTPAYESVTARPVPHFDRRLDYAQEWMAKHPFDAVGWTRTYFRLLDTADRNLGRILDALDQDGLADNTVVVFTSDNGYFPGARGIGDKRLGYEEKHKNEIHEQTNDEYRVAGRSARRWGDGAG